MIILCMKKRFKYITLAMAAVLLLAAPLRGQNSKPQPKPDGAKKEEVKDSLKVSFGGLVTSLQSAQGWIKSNTGKWISSPNRIPYEDPDYNHEFYEKNLIGTENFKQVKVHHIKIDDKSYYAVVVLYTKGYYPNPEVKENWKYFTGADYYIVSKSDFKKIYNDTLQFGEPYTASLRSYYSGTVPYRGESLLGPRISKDINTNIRTRHLYDTTIHTYFQLGVKPVKDKRGRFMRFNFSLAYAKNGNEPSEADYNLFTYQYYEMAFDRFKAFARPGGK